MSILPDTQLYIDGKLRPAADGQTFANVSPWTGKVIGHSADAAPADVEEAIAAARRAFDTTDWSTNHEKRYALIKQFRDAFLTSRDKLVLISGLGRAWGIEGMEEYFEKKALAWRVS